MSRTIQLLTVKTVLVVWKLLYNPVTESLKTFCQLQIPCNKWSIEKQFYQVQIPFKRWSKKPVFTVLQPKLVKTVPPVRKSVTESYTVLEALGVFLRNSQRYIAFDEFCSPTRLWRGLDFLAKAKFLRPRPQSSLLQGQDHKIWP